jgi:TonB-dependent receptor
VNNDQLYDQIATTSSYTQFGGTWRAGRLRAEFLVGRARARETRMQWRTNFGFGYGPATVAVRPDGLWTVTPGSSFDEKDIGNYGRLLAPSDPGSPLVSAPTSLTLANPRLLERGEDTARLDLTYTPNAGIPYLGRIKFGLNRRDYTLASWTGAGYTARAAAGTTPAVVVPRVAGTSSFQACEDTAGSLAPGGTPCRYGTTASTNPATAFVSSIVLSQADYRNIVAQALGPNTIAYFNSLPGRPAGLPASWTEIDVPKVVSFTGVQHFNLDCVQFCAGSDGKVYEQPRTGVRERSMAAYLSADFEIDRLPLTSQPLPFGWTLEGNFGWRVVRTKVDATGLMTFQTSSQTAVTRNTTLRDAATDVMPILNLAWWPVRDRVVVRYSKAKAIARPPVEYLYSNGVTCTTGATNPADGTSCDGTLGNPGLRAATNHNYNLSLEWYPNRDTMLSLTRFRQERTVGAPIRVAVVAQPFAGSGVTDPISGHDLSGISYSYATYVNGPGGERDGFELSSKTAFTFLPSFLRHTGLDLNYTHATSTDQQGPVRDLITGDVLAPANELAYTWNASLWYDDGKLQARVALQGAAAFFRGLTTTTNDYPANGVMGAPVLSFNPATPTFRDARRFLDAKVSYKFDNGIEVFVEGRNLGRKAVTNSQGAYVPFAGGVPNLLDYGYSGAQYMVGLAYRH